MKLSKFVDMHEESELVKSFTEKDWDKYKDENCVVCKKAFSKEATNDKGNIDSKFEDQAVSDVSGKLYHKKCFDKRFNEYDDYHLRSKKEEVPYFYGEKNKNTEKKEPKKKASKKK